jgi:hypothetical protein
VYTGDHGVVVVVDEWIIAVVIMGRSLSETALVFVLIVAPSLLLGAADGGEKAENPINSAFPLPTDLSRRPFRFWRLIAQCRDVYLPTCTYWRMRCEEE